MPQKGVAKLHCEFFGAAGDVYAGKIVEYTFRKGRYAYCKGAENKLIPKIFSSASQIEKKLGDAPLGWECTDNIINCYSDDLRNKKLEKGIKKGAEKSGYKISFRTLERFYNVFIFHFSCPAYLKFIYMFIVPYHRGLCNKKTPCNKQGVWIYVFRNIS